MKGEMFILSKFSLICELKSCKCKHMPQPRDILRNTPDAQRLEGQIDGLSASPDTWKHTQIDTHTGRHTDTHTHMHIHTHAQAQANNRLSSRTTGSYWTLPGGRTQCRWPEWQEDEVDRQVVDRSGMDLVSPGLGGGPSPASSSNQNLHTSQR